MKPLPGSFKAKTPCMGAGNATGADLLPRRGVVSITVVGSELIAVLAVCSAFVTAVVLQDEDNTSASATRLAQRSHPIRDVSAVGPCGSQVAIAWDDRCMIFDRASHQQRLAWLRTGNERLTTIASSSVENVLLLGTSNHGLQLIDTEDCHDIWQLPLSDTIPTAACFSHDGRMLAVGFEKGLVAVIDVDTAHEYQRFRVSDDDLHVLAFTADGKGILVPNDQDGMSLWEVATGHESQKIDIKAGPVTTLAASLDGRYFAVGTTLGTTMIWDALAQREVRRFKESYLPTLAVVFLPDRESVAVAYGSGSIVRTSITRSVAPVPIGRHEDAVRSLTRCNEFLISGGFDGMVRAWNLESGKEAMFPAL